jgi:sigma-B regulation protein RsbU (phosphoserine phosphatase)
MTTLCTVCEGTLDEDRLRTGPLKRVCLECLSDDERRALEHDLEVATQIQARLLPARNFSFGRWQINSPYPPLGAVSGDHIDLIRPGRTGQALHFLFGDVSGKGVAASILMANLQALFRSLVSQELPLGEISPFSREYRRQLVCDAGSRALEWWGIPRVRQRRA